MVDDVSPLKNLQDRLVIALTSDRDILFDKNKLALFRQLASGHANRGRRDPLSPDRVRGPEETIVRNIALLSPDGLRGAHATIVKNVAIAMAHSRADGLEQPVSKERIMGITDEIVTLINQNPRRSNPVTPEDVLKAKISMCDAFDSLEQERGRYLIGPVYGISR